MVDSPKEAKTKLLNFQEVRKSERKLFNSIRLGYNNRSHDGSNNNNDFVAICWYPSMCFLSKLGAHKSRGWRPWEWKLPEQKWDRGGNAFRSLVGNQMNENGFGSCAFPLLLSFFLSFWQPKSSSSCPGRGKLGRPQEVYYCYLPYCVGIQLDGAASSSEERINVQYARQVNQ